MKITPDLDKAMDEITEAFLRWPLPESVCSDLCCCRQGEGRVGTNLLSAVETRAMAEAVIRPIVEKLLAEQNESP